MTFSQKHVWAIFFFLLSSNIWAQEQLGLRQSNYSGVNSLLHNPAWSNGQQLAWDFNIVSAGLFAENNYVFVQANNPFQLLGGLSNLEQVTESDGVHTGANPVYGFFRNDGNDRFAQINAIATGPALLINQENQSFGFFINGRAGFVANNVAPMLAYPDFDELPTGSTVAIEQFKMTGMSWGEMGLNYGKKFNEKTMVAITAKVLTGVDAAFVNNQAQTTITKGSDSLFVQNSNIDYGYVSSVDFSGVPSYKLGVKGWGGAIDLGITTLFGGDYDRPYRLKLGASLLDVGMLRFGKNAVRHQVNSDAAYVIALDEYENVENPEEATDLVSLQSLGSTTATITNDNFQIWTPMGLALQADLAFSKNLFLNASAVRRVKLNGAMLERGNVMALTPRFESRWLEVSVPLSFYNDNDFRYGAALRVGFLTVGTDNLGSFVQTGNLSGTDLYASIKVNPFEIAKKDGYKRRGKSKSKVNCPSNFDRQKCIR